MHNTRNARKTHNTIKNKTINIKNKTIKKKHYDIKKRIKVNLSNRYDKKMHMLNSIEYNKLNELDMEIYKEDITTIYDKFKNIYDKQYINNRIDKINNYKKELNILKNIPYIKQRSPEWYELRKNRLTASDLGDALSNNNHKLAIKKSGLVKDTTNYNIIAPLKWGVMFEPMATRCYSQKNNDIKVHEFGLIADKTLEHFGASPDGINELGIMIEIKCPYSRQIIDGTIPKKYYDQMQGQLAVCNLEECDYIEAGFKIYSSIYTYREEIDSNKKTEHGVIIEYKNVLLDEFEYIYSSPYLTPKEAMEDVEKKMINVDKSLKFIKITYWGLKEMNIQRVLFNKEQWIKNVPKINEFWDKVEQIKQEGLKEEYIKKPKKHLFINDDDKDDDKTKYKFINDDD